MEILKLSKYPLHPAFQFEAKNDDERTFYYRWPKYIYLSISFIANVIVDFICCDK